MFLAAGVSVPGCCQTETLTLPPEQFVLPCARAEPGCSPVPEWCWWLCRAELATAVGPALATSSLAPGSQVALVASPRPWDGPCAPQLVSVCLPDSGAWSNQS